jgi:glycosyltransferase involved in cell wall biosynthesis
MRIAIVQPYVPRYRTALFEALESEATRRGHTLQVFFGKESGRERLRADSEVYRAGRPLSTRHLRVGSRTLTLRKLAPMKLGAPWDVIVCEQAVRNLETYLLLRRRHSRYLAFWGHGRTYTAHVPSAQESLKMWLTKRGDWFFSYTDSGAQHLIRQGFPAHKISVLNNSIDTVQLRADLSTVSDSEVEHFRREHGLTNKTALFIGGIDRPKKIGFLLEAARLAHEADSEFRLLVAGKGEEEALVKQFCASNAWAVHVGAGVSKTKLLALKSAQIMAIPGRLGLAIVDGFVAGLPTVTTPDPLHPPEFEYLEHNRNGFVSPGDADSYARDLVRLLSDSETIERLSQFAIASGHTLSVEGVAVSFLDGLESVFDENARIRP